MGWLVKLSCFNQCEECGKPFKETQFDWSFCDVCLDKVKCPRCGELQTKEWIKQCNDTDCCEKCTKGLEIKNGP